MEVYLYAEMNIFAIVVLFLIYLNTHHKGEKYLIEQKLYKYLLSFNILILATDTIMWVLNGTNNKFLAFLLVFSTVLYFLLHPLICMTWVIYVDFQVNRDENRLKKIIVPLSLPVFINAIFTILSIFCNFLYYFDKDNVYHRGNFFFLIAIFTYSYLLLTFIYVIKEKKKIQRSYYIPILLFSILPSIGGFVQLFFYGLSLIWIGMTLSMLIIFIDIQNAQMHIDYLTGLYNRRQLDFHLKELFHRHNKATIIAGILIDVDSFKTINDYYGHSAGDDALKYTAQILKKSFDENTFISRFGGDEFVILLEINHTSELDCYIDYLKTNLNNFNLRRIAPYEISLSIGSACYDTSSRMTEQEFLNHIDHLMYQDKQVECFR